MFPWLGALFIFYGIILRGKVVGEMDEKSSKKNRGSIEMLAQKYSFKSLLHSFKDKTKQKKNWDKKAFLSNLAKQAIAFMEALLIFSYFFCFRTCSYSLREGGCITISWIPTRSTEASNSYC